MNQNGSAIKSESYYYLLLLLQLLLLLLLLFLLLRLLLPLPLLLLLLLFLLLRLLLPRLLLLLLLLRSCYSRAQVGLPAATTGGSPLAAPATAGPNGGRPAGPGVRGLANSSE